MQAQFHPLSTPSIRTLKLLHKRCHCWTLPKSKLFLCWRLRKYLAHGLKHEPAYRWAKIRGPISTCGSILSCMMGSTMPISLGKCNAHRHQEKQEGRPYMECLTRDHVLTTQHSWCSDIIFHLSSTLIAHQTHWCYPEKFTTSHLTTTYKKEMTLCLRSHWLFFFHCIINGHASAILQRKTFVWSAFYLSGSGEKMFVILYK